MGLSIGPEDNNASGLEKGAWGVILIGFLRSQIVFQG